MDCHHFPLAINRHKDFALLAVNVLNEQPRPAPPVCPFLSYVDTASYGHVIDISEAEEHSARLRLALVIPT
jgi:hypothetical protein